MSKPILSHWECNQKTFDNLKCQSPKGVGKPDLFSGIEIRVVEDVSSGFRPVYRGETPTHWWMIPCCPFENRTFSGGCLSCGDPCF